MPDSTKVYVAVIDGDESLCRSLSQPRRAFGIQPVTQLSAEDFLTDSKRPAADWLEILSSPSEPSNA